MAEWVVLVHVAAAFWFVAGLVGRDVTLAKARGHGDVGTVAELVELAGRFERFAVVPGSFAVLVAGLLAAWAADVAFRGWLLVSVVLYLTLVPLVPLVFLPRSKVFERELASAVARRAVTPELTAAFRDPAVRTARTYEIAVVAAIVVLMVTKPF